MEDNTMQIIIKSLSAEKIDNLISQDTDRFAKVVEHKEDDAVFVDITIHCVKSVVVCEETVTFIFDNGNMFLAHITVTDYYKLEVL